MFTGKCVRGYTTPLHILQAKDFLGKGSLCESYNLIINLTLIKLNNLELNGLGKENSSGLGKKI